jgi:hypothetical protein
MKKIIYTIFAAVGIFSSCSEDFDISLDNYNTGEPIVINIQGEFTEKRSTLKNGSISETGVNDMFYLVYNTSGTLVKKKRFTGDNLSAIKDTLPKGNYKIAILAGIVTPPYAFEPWPYLVENFNTVFMPLGVSGADIFYNHIDIDLNVTGQEIDMVLERQTSKLEIIPTDVNAIPADVESVIFRFKNVDFVEFQFSLKEVNKIIERYTSTARIVQITREDFLSVSESNPISSIIPALGNQTEYPIQVGFVKTGETWPTAFMDLKQSYDLQKNKILRLRGSLFNREPYPGVGIEPGVVIDLDWNAEIVKLPFD